MARMYGRGYQILALFNTEYHEMLRDFSAELMSDPNQRFKLSLEKAPLKNKTKGPNYIQPKSLSDN